MIIGYFADGPWSHKALKKLAANKDVTLAFICGRFGKNDPILSDQARKLGIPFLINKNINSDEFLEKIAQFKCDLFVSMSFDQIFKQKTIDYPRLGAINCHAGKLPFYRGRNVLNWALINDEKEFGITVHYIDDGIDTGDIIKQQCIPIDDTDDYSTLLEKAYEGCSSLLNQSIMDLISGRSERIPQKHIHPLGSYCSARKEGDEYFSWQQSSRQIFNFVRAISPPGPSARCYLGDKELKIKKIQFLPDAPRYIGFPGAILSKTDASFVVKTLDSYVRVLDWECDLSLNIGDRLR